MFYCFLYIFAANFNRMNSTNHSQVPVKKTQTQALTNSFKLTKDDIMLIQPNSVVFSQYSISEVQENILTLITEKLQRFMTNGEEIPVDLFKQPYITILCDEAIGGERNKAKVLKEARNLMTKIFQFSWIHPKMHKTVDSTGVLITTIHDVRGTNQVNLTLNTWAIPFLLYYGVGYRGGGSIFTKQTILSLRGNNTKRIYKLICSQYDKQSYDMSIDEFRKEFMVSDKLNNNYIDKSILKIAEERIKAADADVWFDYELLTKHKIPGRKPKSDTIRFYIHTKRQIILKPADEDKYRYVEKVLFSVVSLTVEPGTCSDLHEIATRKIFDAGKLNEVYDRFHHYEMMVHDGELEPMKRNNIILKILREDWGFDLKLWKRD